MESALKKFGLKPQSPNGQENLLSRLFRRYKSSADTEHEQATLRLLLISIGMSYLWFVAHFNSLGAYNERADVTKLWTEWWLPSMFYIYALGHIISLLMHPGKLFLRCTTMVLLDNLAISAIVIHGGLFSPFVALYFWIAIGYGFRFGPNWLAYSASVSVACILSLLYLNPAWNAGSTFSTSLILSLCITSSYAYFLLYRLRLVQQELLIKAGELEKLATRDNLTGLANRALLMDRLTQAITLAARTGSDVAVLFIDLDGLKKVNDQIGHAAGDALLVEIARKLQARSRAVDTCARIAGDEFVIVLEGVIDRTSVLRVADTMLEEVRGLTTIAGQPIEVSASIGIAWLSLIPERLCNPESLLAVADGAMYKAKRSGKNRYCIADSLAP